MPTTTRNQARRQPETKSELIPLKKPEDIKKNPGSPGRVEEFAALYPVYITVPVPSEVGLGY